MTESIFTVFNNDILISTVADTLLWYFYSRIILLESIGVRSFSSLYGNGVVIDGHIAVLDKDVLAYIKVYGVSRWSLAIVGLAEGIDTEADYLYIITVVVMTRPECGILQFHTLYLYILAVRDIQQARTLLVFVGALSVPFATQPELLVIFQAVAVAGALAGYGEAIQAVNIDESSEVRTCLTLYACLA